MSGLNHGGARPTIAVAAPYGSSLHYIKAKMNQPRPETGAPPRLRRDDSNGVTRLTLARPATRNALSLDMLHALVDVLASIASDRSIRCIILAAEGPAFCAGHDLRELTAAREAPDGGRAFFERTMAQCSSLMRMIPALPQPVIAAVEGVATAAGCQLVAACDLAVAGDSASFCTPGVDIGLFCSTPAVALARNIPRKHAMDMLLTGERVGAGAAQRMGLVNRVVPAGDALAGAEVLARDIARKSAQTIRLGKKTFYAQIDMGLADAYDLASKTMVENLMIDDAREGIGAFLDKRPPIWGHD